MVQRSYIVFSVNETQYEISGDDVFKTAAEFFRYHLGLTGTKIVCAEGDCGACTVLAGNIHEAQDGILSYKTVNSCIIPLYLLDCHHVITVEGLKYKNRLHPVQEAMIKHQGAQCGYCTPGFICALAAYADDALLNRTEMTQKKAANFLTGNLCRCTGYKPILDAATDIDMSQEVSLRERYHDEARNQQFKKMAQIPVKLITGNQSVYLPVSIKSAADLKHEQQQLRIIGGGTDLGVFVNKGKVTADAVLSLQQVPELYEIKSDSSKIWVGARVTLTQLERFLEREFLEMAKLLRIFASPQIKNQGTLIGNVVNGSPIGDTLPYLMIAPAIIRLLSQGGTRDIPITEFYQGYKKLNLKTDEIVTGITLPLPTSHEKIKLYKVSLRKDLDISAVTFAGGITLNENQISNIRLSFGGVAAVVVRLNDMEKEFIGKSFTRQTFQNIASRMDQYIKPLTDLRGSKEYRLLLCQNLLLRFFDDISQEMTVSGSQIQEGFA